MKISTTRKMELQKRWEEFIVPSVLTAEHKVRKELDEILKNPDLTTEERCTLYCRRIAEEIVRASLKGV